MTTTINDITTDDNDRIYTVRIPTIFADDHADRDCLTGVALKRNAHGVVYSCNREELEDWITDAEHYTTMDAWISRSLVASARRALKNCRTTKAATTADSHKGNARRNAEAAVDKSQWAAYRAIKDADLAVEHAQKTLNDNQGAMRPDVYEMEAKSLRWLRAMINRHVEAPE